MHDIKDLRKNIETYKKKLLDRNFDLDINKFKDLDNANRKLINEKEKLEQEKKALSKSKDKSNFDKSKKLSEQISKISESQMDAQNKLNNLLYFLPNLALNDVPIGKDEKSNKLISKEGIVKKFSFKPKTHEEIGLKNNGIDFETSAKLSGSRFVVLKKNYALLERALINFMLDIHTKNFGYTEISPHP